MPHTDQELKRNEFWIDAFLRGLSAASLDWDEYEPDSLAKEACNYAEQLADEALKRAVKREAL